MKNNSNNLPGFISWENCVDQQCIPLISSEIEKTIKEKLHSKFNSINVSDCDAVYIFFFSGDCTHWEWKSWEGKKVILYIFLASTNVQVHEKNLIGNTIWWDGWKIHIPVSSWNLAGLSVISISVEKLIYTIMNQSVNWILLRAFWTAEAVGKVRLDWMLTSFCDEDTAVYFDLAGVTFNYSIAVYFLEPFKK